MTPGTVQVGVDVSKSWFDIDVQPSDESWREENKEQGIQKLVERFKSMPIERIVVEAVQTFTKAIGHHPDYLDAALHRGAVQGGGFTFGQLVLLAKFIGGG